MAENYRGETAGGEGCRDFKAFNVTQLIFWMRVTGKDTFG